MEMRAISLSRRKFTKEFKLAAVRRLETGASLAEVARCGPQKQLRFENQHDTCNRQRC
jgi:transposase-like protein